MSILAWLCRCRIQWAIVAYLIQTLEVSLATTIQRSLNYGKSNRL